MTEQQLKHFEKRPPAQYRCPDFFWRGGNVLREQEFLRDEYKSTLGQLRSLRLHLQHLDHELSDAQDVMREREGYTNALATFLEQDVSQSKQEVELKQHLSAVEAQVREIQDQLENLHNAQNPVVAGALVKEKAFYLIEIQRMQKTIQNYVDQENDAKRQIAACTINGRYRAILKQEAEVERLSQKKERLRVVVARTKIKFEEHRPVPAEVDQSSKDERAALRKNIAVKIARFRMDDRKITRKPKRTVHLNTLLDHIAELNVRLKELGLNDQVVDVAALRKEIMPQPPGKGVEGEEEEEAPQEGSEVPEASQSPPPAEPDQVEETPVDQTDSFLTMQEKSRSLADQFKEEEEPPAPPPAEAEPAERDDFADDGGEKEEEEPKKPEPAKDDDDDFGDDDATKEEVPEKHEDAKDDDDFGDDDGEKEETPEKHEDAKDDDDFGDDDGDKEDASPSHEDAKDDGFDDNEDEQRNDEGHDQGDDDEEAPKKDDNQDEPDGFDAPADDESHDEPEDFEAPGDEDFDD
jgi:hypothetical protein